MEASQLLIVARWGSFAAAMILFGSSLFWLYAPRLERERIAKRPFWAGMALLLLVAQGVWLAALANGLDPGEPLFAGVGAILFETGFGPVWLARLALGAIALVAASLRSRALLVAAAGLWLCGEGWDGHATGNGLAGNLIQSAHVVCAGGWIGGLFPLLRRLALARRDGDPDILATLRCFSNVATGFVIVLFLTGALNAIEILGPRPGWTDYLALLIGKIALFGAMLALAAANRFVFMKRAKGADHQKILALIAAATLAEIVAGGLALLAVSALGTMNPFGPAPP